MKWLILGALLGLLIACPLLLGLVVDLVATLAAQPVVVAFAAGLVVRPCVRRVRRCPR